MTPQIDFDYYSPKEPNAPNLVFIHGAGGDKTQWEKQKSFFQQHGWGIISLSLPSHGQSSPSESLNLGNYVETVYKIITNQKLENVTLIGHSMGGAIALQFTLQYPGSIIKKLILIGTGAKLKVAPAFFDAIETDFNRFLELLGRLAFYKDTMAQIKLDNEEAIRRNGGKIFLQDFQICDMFDIRSELNKITKKTLIIVGQDDQMTPVKYSTFLHEKLKNSQLTIIPEAGHYVFQEKPLDVNNEIYKFITE